MKFLGQYTIMYCCRGRCWDLLPWSFHMLHEAKGHVKTMRQQIPVYNKSSSTYLFCCMISRHVCFINPVLWQTAIDLSMWEVLKYKHIHSVIWSVPVFFISGFGHLIIVLKIAACQSKKMSSIHSFWYFVHMCWYCFNGCALQRCSAASTVNLHLLFWLELH